MEDTTTPSQSEPDKRSPTKTQLPPPQKHNVSRTRRSIFAFVTVGFSMYMMAYFGLKGLTNEAAMSALDGFKEVAIWIGAAYIGGSAVDYSAAMISRRYGRGGGGYNRYGGDGRISD